MTPDNSFRGLVVPILIVLLAVAGCRRPAGPERSEPKSEGLPVRVAAVTNVLWEKTVSIVGTLYAKDTATIGAQVDGMVERTLVDFGDRVTNGQDLAFIDTTTYEAQLQQQSGNLAKAEANLANARQNHQRLERLKAQGIASDSDYEAAKAQLDQWEGEVKAARGTESVARLNLQHSRVQAPFDGAIAQRIVGRGDYVRVGGPLYDLVNDSVLKFIFPVPERFGSKVTKRLPVRFQVDNYPGETFTGSVYLISPAVNTSSRAFSVGALVTNTNFRLKANTFARGTLVLEPGVPTSAVPVEAVVSYAGVTRVFAVDGAVARSRPVRVGRVADGLQEVTEGLKPGELVVVNGQGKLTDGAAVVVGGKAPGGKMKGAGDEH